MSWNRLEQTERFLLIKNSFHGIELSGDIYKDHLLILDPNSKKEILRCWNPGTSIHLFLLIQFIANNSWMNSEIKTARLSGRTSNLVVYKNLLAAFGVHGNKFSLALLNIESKIFNYFNLLSLLIDVNFSIQEKGPEPLFMHEEGSDISFKIEGQIIPAHKQILVEKSRYFKNLFNSGMAESRQKIIELDNCELAIFKGLSMIQFLSLKNIIEFLRFLYCKEIKIEDGDVNFALKLHGFADKFLQQNLQDECVDFLISNLASDNVYLILDFARQENIPRLKNCCIKLLQVNLNINSISGLIKYLEQQDLSQEENIQLRNRVISFILGEYGDISMKETEAFLINNIAMENIKIFLNFLCPQSSTNSSYFTGNAWALEEKAGDDFEKDTANLKNAVSRFVLANIDQIKQSNITQSLPQNFLLDLVSYAAGVINKQENQDESVRKSPKGLKRMEPGKKEDMPEDEPTLKKPK